MAPARYAVLNPHAVVGWAFWAAFALSGAGCVSMHGHKIDTQAGSKLAVNVNQVRLKMRSMVGPMSGEIERAADQIAAGTTEPEVRTAAVRWKIDGVHALTTALFEPEPITAVLDSWALVNQMADFFETGPGRAQLGAGAPVAVEACRRLEEQVAAAAASMSATGEAPRLRVLVREWALAHPIRYTIPSRETTLSRALEREVPESWTTGDAVVEVVTSVDDLNRKVDVYRDQFFRQVRWEADLLASDLKLGEVQPLAERAVQSTERAAQSAERAAATFDALAPGFERAVAVAESGPAMIAAERKAAMAAFSQELSRTIAFLQQERLAALAQVTSERIDVMESMSRTISEERKAFDRDIERVVFEVVDHALWRLAQLAAAGLVFLGLGTAALLVFVRWLFPTSLRA